MKKRILSVFLILLLVIPANFAFGVDPDQSTVVDVEVSVGELDFKVNDTVYDITVNADVEVIEFYPEYAEELLDDYLVEFKVGDVAVESEDEGNTFVIDLEELELLSELDVEMIVSEESDDTNDDYDVIDTYTFTIDKSILIKEMYVTTDENEYDLIPEFDMYHETYLTVLETSEEDVMIDIELPEVDDVKVYLDDDSNLFTKDGDVFSYEIDDDEIDLHNNVFEIYVDVMTNDDPEDWTTVSTYKVDIYVATLESIQVSDDGANIELDPGFAGNLLDYTATVAYDVETVSISAQVDTESDAVIKMMFDGSVSTPVAVEEDINDETFDVYTDDFDLDVGVNVIEVVEFLDNGPEDDFEVIYTVEIVREDALTSLHFKYDDDPDEDEEEYKNLYLEPDFVAGTYEYDLYVPYDVEELEMVYVVFDEADVFLDGDEYDGEVIEVEPGTTTIEVSIEGDDPYVIHLRRPVLINDITANIDDFDFEPTDFVYNEDVPYEQDSVEFEIVVDEGVSVYVNDVELEDPTNADDEDSYTAEVDLDFGKNTIIIQSEYDGVYRSYKIRVDRDHPEDEDKDQPNRDGYTYRHMHLGIDVDDHEITFDPDAYDKIVGAFKWGSNRDNVITVEIEDDDFTLQVPYSVYKFMVQRKVTLRFTDGNEENDFEFSLKDQKLSRVIKGPNHVETVIFDIDFDDQEVDEISYLYSDFFKLQKMNNEDFEEDDNDDNEDDDDDEDDEDDDDDKKMNNSKKPNKK